MDGKWRRRPRKCSSNQIRPRLFQPLYTGREVFFVPRAGGWGGLLAFQAWIWPRIGPTTLPPWVWARPFFLVMAKRSEVPISSGDLARNPASLGAVPTPKRLNESTARTPRPGQGSAASINIQGRHPFAVSIQAPRRFRSRFSPRELRHLHRVHSRYASCRLISSCLISRTCFQ